jgi:hypothetical protein
LDELIRGPNEAIGLSSPVTQADNGRIERLRAAHAEAVAEIERIRDQPGQLTTGINGKVGTSILEAGVSDRPPFLWHERIRFTLLDTPWLRHPHALERVGRDQVFFSRPCKNCPSGSEPHVVDRPCLPLDCDQLPRPLPCLVLGDVLCVLEALLEIKKHAAPSVDPRCCGLPCCHPCLEQLPRAGLACWSRNLPAIEFRKL